MLGINQYEKKRLFIPVSAPFSPTFPVFPLLLPLWLRLRLGIAAGLLQQVVLQHRHAGVQLTVLLQNFALLQP